MFALTGCASFKKKFILIYVFKTNIICVFRDSINDGVKLKKNDNMQK